VVFLHALEKDTGAVPQAGVEPVKQRMADFKRWIDAFSGGRRELRAKTRLPRIRRYGWLDKLGAVPEVGGEVSCLGRTALQASRSRAGRSPVYRAARAEYAAIRALRENNWIAAHIRERRYELDLT